ncbi:hypothetical protein BpHYR1_005507 [Brachionus plicatilis]|uniref:Uncharacterized protein n=1 Tax=Brachionus plicatilis TaxID=10195 RepID=A0A3M7Q743_BRAPC|nr:hypothetical protein BpHYR1_005507 [Brachionus plicatilis]
MNSLKIDFITITQVLALPFAPFHPQLHFQTHLESYNYLIKIRHKWALKSRNLLSTKNKKNISLFIDGVVDLVGSTVPLLSSRSLNNSESNVVPKVFIFVMPEQIFAIEYQVYL